MNGAQWLVNTLRNQQVDTVFGYPGGAIMPVYDALYDGGVRHVLCRHEQGAAMAAIGYARASGKIGVCIATSGPGATNLITGLADALLDSVPVLAITGQVGSALIGTDAFQEVDVLGLSLACTKHSFLVQSSAELPRVLSEAYQLALSGRPGPVLVDIPKDIQQAVYPFVPYVDQQRETGLLNKPLPAEFVVQTSLLERGRQMIARADKPVLYAGGGVAMAKAVVALREFLAVTGMPVVTTLKALGTVTADYDGYLGMPGMHGMPAANHAIQQCDLLIALGARFDDRVTGRPDSFAPHAKVMHLDIDPAEFNKLRQADLPLCGDLNDLLAQLQQPLHIVPWQQRVRQLKNQYRWRYDSHYQGLCRQEQQQEKQQVNPQQARHKQEKHYHEKHGHEKYSHEKYSHEKQGDEKHNHEKQSHENRCHGDTHHSIDAPLLLKQLSDCKPSHCVVTTDVGQHQMWTAQHMTFSQPENFISSSGLGTMGFGLPAAIGAQLARPDCTVLCVSGDGSFMMNVQELATVKRLGLPLKIVLLDNQRLGMVRQWQQLFFDHRYSETHLDDNPDFVALAQVFAIAGQRIERQDQLAAALDTLFNHQGAYLLHVRIHALDNVWPLVPPGASNSDMLEQIS